MSVSERSEPRPGGGRGRSRPVYSDRGIVLRSYKLGESDKILRVLTRQHGKRSAVAKGVRKTTSRFGARLEPLTCARLLMHRGRSMDTISQVEIETSFHEVREDLDLFVHASAMAELVDCITEEHDPHPELFDIMLNGLGLLKENPERAPFVLAFFEYRVLAVEGFELQTTACAGCGGATGEGEVSFSLNLGGLVCDACRGEGRRNAGKLIRVGGGTARLLSWMSANELGDWPAGARDPRAEGEIRFLMDRVLEHWMEKEFKSHRVMKVMPGGSGVKAKGG